MILNEVAKRVQEKLQMGWMLPNRIKDDDDEISVVFRRNILNCEIIHRCKYTLCISDDEFHRKAVNFRQNSVYVL